MAKEVGVRRASVAPTALPRQAGAGGIIIHRCPSPNPGLGSHGRLHGKPGQAGQARLAGRPSGPRERMGSLLRSSHAGTNEALALPALKRVIRVETLSQSAKALLPPHKCGGSHHQFGQDSLSAVPFDRLRRQSRGAACQGRRPWVAVRFQECDVPVFGFRRGGG